ncbi:MAG: hypothetical protein GX801_06720 [Fibrobacter sp.]|nr:hypothetical protein [Fibrobacter sp.]
MNTHLRKLIKESRKKGWEFDPVQSNGAQHFEHKQYGRVYVACTPADWHDECIYTRQRMRRAKRRFLDK